ncbi:hypothetical protein AB835_03845 [Candidatus Endobugula sertula]|uniref:Uncharacterized protein n=1 Tax=Candidatus Endobugula sertula TaxID=62101 RepID=A0A1D2QS73_9GAMM|nr:hypothetical protein AB835_03845 [Candidatus Endobugula sertula]
MSVQPPHTTMVLSGQQNHPATDHFFRCVPKPALFNTVAIVACSIKTSPAYAVFRCCVKLPCWGVRSPFAAYPLPYEWVMTSVASAKKTARTREQNVSAGIWIIQRGHFGSDKLPWRDTLATMQVIQQCFLSVIRYVTRCSLVELPGLANGMACASGAYPVGLIPSRVDPQWWQGNSRQSPTAIMAALYKVTLTTVIESTLSPTRSVAEKAAVPRSRLQQYAAWRGACLPVILACVVSRDAGTDVDNRFLSCVSPFLDTIMSGEVESHVPLKHQVPMRILRYPLLRTHSMGGGSQFVIKGTQHRINCHSAHYSTVLTQHRLQRLVRPPIVNYKTTQRFTSWSPTALPLVLATARGTQRQQALIDTFFYDAEPFAASSQPAAVMQQGPERPSAQPQPDQQQLLQQI